MPNETGRLYCIIILIPKCKALKQQDRFSWRTFLFLNFFMFKTYNYLFFHVNLALYITKNRFRHKSLNEWC